MQLVLEFCSIISYSLVYAEVFLSILRAFFLFNNSLEYQTQCSVEYSRDEGPDNELDHLEDEIRLAEERLRARQIALADAEQHFQDLRHQLQNS